MYNFPEIWCVHITVWYNLSYIAVCTHFDTNSIYFTSAVFKRNHEVRDRWRLYGKSSFLASNSVNYNSVREKYKISSTPHSISPDHLRFGNIRVQNPIYIQRPNYWIQVSPPKNPEKPLEIKTVSRFDPISGDRPRELMESIKIIFKLVRIKLLEKAYKEVI